MGFSRGGAVHRDSSSCAAVLGGAQHVTPALCQQLIPASAWQGCSPLIPPCSAPWSEDPATWRGGGVLSLLPPSPSGKGEDAPGEHLLSCPAGGFLMEKKDASKAPCHVAVRCHLCSLGHLNLLVGGPLADVKTTKEKCLSWFVPAA